MSVALSITMSMLLYSAMPHAGTGQSERLCARENVLEECHLWQASMMSIPIGDCFSNGPSFPDASKRHKNT